MNSREKNASFKKRVYLIPHTHWDREWYFTYQTANVLLHHDFNEFEKLDRGKWFLDGQWSLVNDLVKWSSTRRQRIEEAISKGNLSVGPLYSQPDVFNSQGETIIRNFEMGAKMAQEFKTPQLKTAYLPDTFGFGQNMPQILKHCKMDYFVFWRGLNEEQLAKNDFFIWKGVDGSKIKVLVLREGYFSLGMHYPYNEGLIWPHKNNPSHFLDKVLNRINSIKGTHKSYILPLGGDQAPFLYSQNTFVQKLNSLSLDYSFILDSNFDKYLSGKNFTSVFEGDLRTPITGKIHRTITSSRYDIKKNFREAEDKLYYLLEPLEFFYANYNNIYNFEKYKDENILKPLFLAQAHDSLGGCNTDTTNQNQLSRLKLIQENIESQVDLLLKKIIQDSKIPTETITIFNPAPFFNNMAQRQIIYSTIPGSVAIDKPYLKLKTLSSKNISFNKDKPLFKKEVLVYAQKLSPLSLAKASLDKIKKIDLFETEKGNLEIEKNKLVFLIGKQKVKFSLNIKKDNGDAYDSSPGTHVPIKIKLLKAFTTKMGKMKFTSVLARVNKCRVQIDFFLEDAQLKIRGVWDNKLKSHKVSLNIEGEFATEPELLKSQHLALVKFVEKEDNKDWQKNLKEYPAHVDAHDGIIDIGKKIYVFTKGTNEIYKIKNGVQITLFRTFQKVTGKNLAWRPTTSGLSWDESSLDSQLQKKLYFDFQISTKKLIPKYNEFKFQPYLYMVQNRNFIANKMNKFVLNNIIQKPQKQNTLSINNPNIFISGFQKKKKKLELRLVNLENKENELILVNNSRKIKIKFKTYEIKKIVLDAH